MSKQKNRRRAKKPKRRVPKSPAPHVSNLQSEIMMALGLQQAGDHQQAGVLYERILKREPGNPDAWHLLGMVRFAEGRFDAAVACLQKAIERVPNHPEVLANLGIVYRGMGELQQAKEVMLRSLELQPQSLSARNNLGTVLLELQEFDLAEAQFQAVLRLDPSFTNAKMNLGNVWQKQGRLRDAEQLYHDVLRQDPDNGLVLNNLGETLRHQGAWQEAAEVFERALRQSPDSATAQINLGRTWVNLGQHEKAQTLFSRLIEQQPALSKPYHYLGKTFLDAKDLPKAAANIERCLELDPTDAFAHCSLGFAYLESGRAEEATTCFRNALQLDPDMHEAHSSMLFIMSGNIEMNQQELFEEHKKWGAMHGNRAPLAPLENDPNPHRRLRIGYVSRDFRAHAVAAYLRPVLEQHDREQVETFCYSDVALPDKMTEQLQSLSHNWRPIIGLSDEQVASCVHSDSIDILVDLAGHTSENRLKAFALRPAPIQITWIGYPNTTGLDAIDYRLTCETQNPPGEPSYHTEQLVRLKYGSFCFSPPSNLPELTPLPAIQNGHITFGSLHRPFKITPSVWDVWAKVLLATPNSRMIIFNTRFTEESSSQMANGLVSRGVSSDRFEIRNEIRGQTYLEVYDEIDIALDVFPWAGGTTTLEALSMGVPVVALYGDRRSARSTAAIVKQTGLEDLIGYTPDEYVKLAEGLANAPQRLSSLRHELRETIGRTVCNADRFTRDLEKTFREMWTRWCRSR